MARILVIEDVVQNAIDLREAIVCSCQCERSEVEIWQVAGLDVDRRNVVSEDGSYQILGLKQAFESISESEADLVIVDLQLDDARSSALIDFANSVAPERPDPIREVLERNPLQAPGLLLLDEFFRARGDSGRAIVMSNHAGTAAPIFQFHGKRYEGYPIAVMSDLAAAAMAVFPDVESRVWPTHTDGWFVEAHDVVPHNPFKRGPQILGRAKTAIREYLHGLFGVGPPEKWFGDDQFEWLVEDLKHMIGSTSIFRSRAGGSRTLTLGNVALLFGASLGDFRDKTKHVFQRLDWKSNLTCIEILSKQQKPALAKEVVLGMVDAELGLFPKLMAHDIDGRFLVGRLSFQSHELRICYQHDFRVARNPQQPNSALIPKLLRPFDSALTVDGGATSAFLRLQGAMGRTESGVDSHCTLSFYNDWSGPCSDLVFRPVRGMV